ncbi:Uncharacterised protein [Burkholderia pseudomallei]|nr:Uncharacterised protein [Burkholderia pseudomallei]
MQVVDPVGGLLGSLKGLIGRRPDDRHDLCGCRLPRGERVVQPYELVQRAEHILAALRQLGELYLCDLLQHEHRVLNRPAERPERSGEALQGGNTGPVERAVHAGINRPDDRVPVRLGQLQATLQCRDLLRRQALTDWYMGIPKIFLLLGDLGRTVSCDPLRSVAELLAQIGHFLKPFANKLITPIHQPYVGVHAEAKPCVPFPIAGDERQRKIVQQRWIAILQHGGSTNQMIELMERQAGPSIQAHHALHVAQVLRRREPGPAHQCQLALIHACIDFSHPDGWRSPPVNVFGVVRSDSIRAGDAVFRANPAAANQKIQVIQ